jgi:hypothetical protein
MTVWQKISGLATAVGDAGGNLLDELGRTFGLSRPDGEPLKDIAFTIAVIALSAKMAKADGVVSPLELKAFEEVFRYRRKRRRMSSACSTWPSRTWRATRPMPIRSRRCSRTTASSCSMCSKA